MRMRIVVTGGSGKLGTEVLKDLVRAGHDVVNVDRVKPSDPEAAAVPFSLIDMTDYGQVLQALMRVDERVDGVDAVVHLAAIPAPGLQIDGPLFADNTLSTYNVFAAARLAGIKRVVWASSETLLGLPFSSIAPPYIPVDEEYAVRPESSYSLSKAVGEELARHFARWVPDAGYIGLRFSNVMVDADYAEYATWQDDPSARAWNLWGYIDARDGAQAVRLAVESDLTGAENFIIAAEDTTMRADSAALAAATFPDVAVRHPLEGRQTLLSIDKAKRMLGYAPQYSWLDRI
jgi:nucleoside-diphosphate-sugar epimerase